MSTSPEKNEASKNDKKKKAAPAKKVKVSAKLSLVQDAIALMDGADLSELAFEQSGVRIHLRRGPASFPAAMSPLPVQPMAQAPLPAAASPAASAPAPAPKNDGTVTINSPMVGTFYRAPSPDAKAFIEEGDKVEVGQVFCIIEAMKLMNEVKAETAGKVVKIIAQNGQAIEFNQPLIIVDPS